MNIKKGINGLIRTVFSFSKTNAPTLLTAAEIVLGGTTAVIVYKKSPEAHAKKTVAVAKARTEGKSKVAEKVEAAKAVSKVMWPAYITGAAATGCLIASNKISNDRLAATAAACGYLERKLEAMREAEKEVLGENKAADLNRKAAEKMMEKSDANPDDPIEPSKQYPGLRQLYYDMLNDRYLRSSVEELFNAANVINGKVKDEYYDGPIDDDGHYDCEIGPNDFYREVGWPETKAAKGWTFPPKSCYQHGENGIGMVVNKTSVIAPNGETAIVLDFENMAPKWG